MVFSNAAFLFFFLPITLVGYYFPAFKHHIELRNVILLIASLIFYAWGEPLYVFLMILSILVNYSFGRLVGQNSKSTKDKEKIRKGKRIVLFACVYNLGVLFVFKYLDWILSGLSLTRMHTLNLPLPIGISFYTFQALSYVLDVYRGKDKAQTGLINIGLYIAFFPQLIAGPIVRYSSIAQQLKSRNHTAENFTQGVYRFIIGLSKKLILANQLASVSDLTFGSEPKDLSAVLAWIGALAFMLQIYFDFSGYSDMAIGLGKMFGFEFNENFNYPYVSHSVTEYWRRWHISLGEWFRDYVYYPLSMGKAVRIRKAVFKKTNSRKLSGYISSFFVLFIVWMLTGLWHGANLTFVVWGLLQFVCIFAEQFRKNAKNTKGASAIKWCATFLIVLLSKVVFKSDSLGQAIRYYGAMFGLVGNGLIDNHAIYYLSQYKMYLIAGLIFCFPVIPFLRKRIAEHCGKPVQVVSSVLSAAALLCLLWIDASHAIGGGYNPFIYFNF